MTESVTATPSPRLERPRESAFRGVCSALARQTGTDPVLWRVLVVVLTLFNGLGILLYLAGIVTIPAEDEEHSLAERLLRGPDRRLRTEQVIVLVLLVIVAGSYLGDPSAAVVLAVGAALGVLWWRGRHGHPGDTAAPPSTPLEPVSTQVPVPVWTPPPPLPPRPRSPFGGVTAAVAAIVAGVLVLVGVSGPSVPAEVVIASALGVVGLGLVIGSFWGRSWGLWLLATGLGLALVATLGVRPVLDHGVGERTWTPTTSGSYQLGIGEGTLDLSRLTDGGTVKAHLTIGHLLVLVPDGMGVDIDAKATTGAVEVFGKEQNGRRPEQHLTIPGTPTVTLDLSIRTGYVEVRRA